MFRRRTLPRCRPDRKHFDGKPGTIQRLYAVELQRNSVGATTSTRLLPSPSSSLLHRPHRLHRSFNTNLESRRNHQSRQR
jgi:hypothetical protein